MNLKNLLAPVMYVDEQVLRQYTKLGRRLGLDKGKRRYYAGFVLDGLNCVFSLGVSDYFGLWFVYLDSFFTSGIDCGCNMWGVISSDVTQSNGTKAVNPIDLFYNRIQKPIRLPVLLAGVLLVGKFGLDVYDNITSGKPIDDENLFLGRYGLSLIVIASSMYLKDQDPKLLEKKPLWRQACDYISDKLRSEPAPQPTLSPIRYSLETRLQGEE